MHIRLSAVVAAVMLTAVGVADAAVFQVDRTDDAPGATACDGATPNDCSLRGALIAANAAASAASEVQVPAGVYLRPPPRPVRTTSPTAGRRRS